MYVEAENQSIRSRMKKVEERNTRNEYYIQENLIKIEQNPKTDNPSAPEVDF